MQKRFTFWLGSSGLALALCCLYFPGIAQNHYSPDVTLAANYTGAEQKASARSLKEVLTELRKAYGIQFSYKTDIEQDLELKIPASLSEEKNIDVLLTKILAPGGLKYKKVKEVYIIYKDEKSRGKQESSFIRLNSNAKTTQADITITGKVTDENGGGLPGVTVLVKGTTTATPTDASGNYSITVPNGNGTLVFSYIGYETQEVPVNNRATINVTLGDDAKALEEVVVVGYGTQKKSDITGAVASIKSEELKSQPLTSVDQGLQGRASGVQVTQSSGQPGAVASIRIRGGNSIQGGNEPLYVIDGFPVYGGGGLETPGAGPNINPMATLSPSDIQSIEILKDASATAIYGSRGANGVVLITTKGGTRGRDVVSFESYYGIQEVRKTIDVMNASQFAQLVNDAYTNDGLEPVYTPQEITAFGEGTDWQDEIFRTAPIQNYQLSFSGGDDKTTYAISGGYFRQEGIVINSNFDRINSRVNVNRKLNSKFNVGTHLTINRTTGNTVRSSTDGEVSAGAVLGAILISPTLDVYENPELGIYNQLNNRGLLLPNPVATAREIKNTNNTLRLLGDIYGQYEIMSGLNFKVSLGTDIINNKGNYYIPSIIAQGTGTNGYGLVSSSMSTTWLNENILTYNKQINK